MVWTVHKVRLASLCHLSLDFPSFKALLSVTVDFITRCWCYFMLYMCLINILPCCIEGNTHLMANVTVLCASVAATLLYWFNDWYAREEKGTAWLTAQGRAKVYGFSGQPCPLFRRINNWRAITLSLASLTLRLHAGVGGGTPGLYFNSDWLVIQNKSEKIVTRASSIAVWAQS